MKISRFALVLYPLLSLLIATATVSSQYARKARLTRELAAAEREYSQLFRQAPKSTERSSDTSHRH